jgi:hypothetical protein
VFDALSYFCDNQAEIAAHIELNTVPQSLSGIRREPK